MNLLTLEETDQEIRLSVHYTSTDGSVVYMAKKPFSYDAQLRRTAILLRNLADRIDKHDTARHLEVMKGLHD